MLQKPTCLIFIILVAFGCADGVDHVDFRAISVGEQCSASIYCDEGLVCEKGTCIEKGNFPWQFGGADSGEIASEVTLDAEGNIYVLGTTTSQFDGNRSEGQSDLFLVKFDKNGTKQWTKQFGESTAEIANDLVLDNRGNLYITGVVRRVEPEENNDLLAAKYTVDGEPVWNITWGEQRLHEVPVGVAIDSQGYLYVAGTKRPTKTASAIQGMLLRFDPDGHLDMKKFWGGPADVPFGLAIDEEDNIYTIGFTTSFFPLQTAISIRRFDRNGQQRADWKRRQGENESGTAITIDADGSVYAAGVTDTAFLSWENIQQATAFAGKWTKDGEEKWFTTWGDGEVNGVWDIALDKGEIVYVVGFTNKDLNGEKNLGGYDIFLAELNSNDGELQSTRLIGTELNDLAYSLALDDRGYAYLAGTIAQTMINQYWGDGDALVHRIPL